MLFFSYFIQKKVFSSINDISIIILEIELLYKLIVNVENLIHIIL